MSTAALSAATLLTGALLLLSTCGGGGGGGGAQDNPPQATIEGISDGTLIDAPILITLRATDDIELSSTLLEALGIPGSPRMVGGTSSEQQLTLSPSPVFPPGPGRIDFTATDSAGQTDTASVNVVIPDQAPVIELEGLRNGDLLAAAVTVNIFVLDAGGIASVVVRIDAGEVLSALDPGNEFSRGVVVDPALLSPGEHQFSVVATDEAGLISSQALIFSTPL
jgi:hypothetical protein